MKNLILILIILFSVSSFAKKKEIPKPLDLSGYTLLLNKTESTQDMARVYDHTADCMVLIADMKIASKVELENSCSEVVSKILVSTAQGPSRFTLKQVNIQFYCIPRTFSEVAVMSLYRKCMESPQPECFSPAMLAQLNQIKSTTYKEIITKSCEY